MSNKSLGLIEIKGLAAGIEAADAAVKSANVSLVGYEVKRMGGMVTVKVEGDVGAVQAAVQAASTAASRLTNYVSAHVIPRPSQELEKLIRNADTVGHVPIQHSKPEPPANPPSDKPEAKAAPVATEQPVPVKETPPAKEEAQPVKETLPAKEEAQPVKETPPAKEEAQPVKETLPAKEEAQPVKETPPAKEEVQPVKETLPAKEEAQPAEEIPKKKEPPAGNTSPTEDGSPRAPRKRKK